MRNPIGIRGPIDTRSPVNWAHPLNAGLLVWVLATKNQIGGAGPSYLTPGTVARPLAGGPLVFSNSPTLAYTNGWPVSSSLIVPRPGGFGCIVGSNNGGYAKCSLPVASFTNFTLSGWVLQSSNGDMFPLGVAPSSGKGFGFFYSAETPYVFFSDASANLTRNIWGSSVALDSWHHIVGTHVAGSTTIAMYVDGVPGGSMQFTSATDPAPNSGPLALGQLGLYTGLGFGGGLDDVRLYARVLSASQIQELYRLSLIGYPGLVNRIYPQLGSVAPSGTPHLAQPYLTARIDPRFLQEREFI